MFPPRGERYRRRRQNSEVGLDEVLWSGSPVGFGPLGSLSPQGGNGDFPGTTGTDGGVHPHDRRVTTVIAVTGPGMETVVRVTEAEKDGRSVKGKTGGLGPCPRRMDLLPSLE